MENEHTPGKPYKSLRGGSWYFFSEVARCAVRSRNEPGDFSNYYIGFRCARTSP